MKTKENARNNPKKNRTGSGISDSRSKLKRVESFMLTILISCALMFSAVPVQAAETVPADPAQAAAADPAAQAAAEQAAAEAAAAQAAAEEAARKEAEEAAAIVTNGIANWPQGPSIKEETGILMDAETGAIIYNKRMDDRRYPASTTKIMTALLAIENSNMTDIVTMTEAGMAEAYSGSSNILPVLGEQFTMEQCLYMILLKSANDVSTQVAEYVGGGSVENFVNMMNERAAQIGCINTHFNNANGLPDENHYTTAHDLALIMKEALRNETFRNIIHTTQYVVPATNLTPGARTYDNHHHMLLPDDPQHYEGIIGGKTGYTDAALATLVTACERNGMTLISVVMKATSPDTFNDTISLMDYGYMNFQKLDMSQNDSNLVGTVIVPNGVTQKDIQVEEQALQTTTAQTPETPDTAAATESGTTDTVENATDSATPDAADAITEPAAEGMGPEEISVTQTVYTYTYQDQYVGVGTKNTPVENTSEDNSSQAASTSDKSTSTSLMGIKNWNQNPILMWCIIGIGSLIIILLIVLIVLKIKNKKKKRKKRKTQK